jgi:hypothetical protein
MRSRLVACLLLLGPTRRETGASDGRFQAWEFRKACTDALGAMDRLGRVPSCLWVECVVFGGVVEGAHSSYNP